MVKKIYVVANWKMYKTAREASDYIEKLLPHVEDSQVNIYLSVPFTSIAAAAGYAKETNIVVGAQNMNDAREGAFTGEIAGLMLKEAGADFVLLGHSERRHIFGESNELIHRKVLRAFSDDIQPILCVGETAKERDAKKTEKVLKEQILSALDQVPKEDIDKLILAYEPVWAIGSGKTATPKHIQEAHAFCRKCLIEVFGKKKGADIPLLYGGSVKPANAAEIIAEKDVDGVLVGGASLDPEMLSEMIHNIEGKPAVKAARKPLAKKTSKPAAKKAGKPRIKKEKKK
ncbi:MAG: triose-phosphate isomerase [Chlamydiae bacterium CG10_big_fil_rev_8_21_14_0_10_42_34]|nr:MAG: triose-phosphate isomerase [Chlamydiae bacterium CG10_big_fil_rev_8_21_14_0_10_42_34]